MVFFLWRQASLTFPYLRSAVVKLFHVIDPQIDTFAQQTRTWSDSVPGTHVGGFLLFFLGWFWMETVEAADWETITLRALHSLFLSDSFIMKSNHFWFCLGPVLVHFAMISAHCERTLAGRRSSNVGDVYSNCKLRSSKDSWWTDEDTNHALVDSRRDCCVCVCESTGCELG